MNVLIIRISIKVTIGHAFKDEDLDAEDYSRKNCEDEEHSTRPLLESMLVAIQGIIIHV